MKIGNVTIHGKAALAPMAGVADRAFRELCVQYGAGYVVGEMVSSKGISMGDKKSAGLLALGEEEHPAAIQLFGDNPQTMAQAAEHSLRYRPDVIDLNMGCPVPKVAGNGGGSALMKNIPLAVDITAAVVNAVPIPVTVKIRTGWDETNKNAVEMAKRLEAAGARCITVHGRTRSQMYAPPADWETIRLVKEAVSIPVIGNGDVVDAASAAALYEQTNCDYIMVGRAALGTPWIFAQINAYLENGIPLPPPPLSERMRVMLRHVETLCRYKGEYVGMREARKHAAWYMKGIRGAASFRKQAGTLEHIEQLQELAYQVLAAHIE